MDIFFIFIEKKTSCAITNKVNQISSRIENKVFVMIWFKKEQGQEWRDEQAKSILFCLFFKKKFHLNLFVSSFLHEFIKYQLCTLILVCDTLFKLIFLLYFIAFTRIQKMPRRKIALSSIHILLKIIIRNWITKTSMTFTIAFKV